MPNRSDTSLAALLLTQRLVEGVATPLRASGYWSLIANVGDPGSLLGLDATAVADIARVDRAQADRIAGLLDSATAFAFELDRAEQSGIHLIASVDDGYPDVLADRLGFGAPPLLYVVGDPRVLGADLLGVVGSRDVSEAGAGVARSAAAEAARHGLGVVSGGAKGVDRLAMQAGLDAGAAVVGVFAGSLVRTARDAEVRRQVIDGRLCLCTPYKPSAGFSVANAMGRNRIIHGLSQATLVVAAEAESGGTWAGAVEALRLGIAPVLVWTGDGAGSGNTGLARLGAHEVGAVDALFPLPPVAGHGRTAGGAASQLSLGL